MHFIGILIGSIMFFIGIVETFKGNYTTSLPLMGVGAVIWIICFRYGSRKEKKEKERVAKLEAERLQALNELDIRCKTQAYKPIETPDIILDRDERCYFNQPAYWSESKLVLKNIMYSGLRYKYNLSKALSWSVGTLKPITIKTQHWDRKDTGDVYITNKRLIFNGNTKTLSIKLDNILDVDVFSQEGILVGKNNGNKALFVFEPHVSIAFNNILSRVFNETIEESIALA